MATPEKRGRPFNHYGGGGSHGSQQAKRHKTHDNSTTPQDNRQGFKHSYGRGARDQIESELERHPDPANCEPCKLAASERQSGMIALLDQLVYEEAGPNADKEILHYARQLRDRLAARANELLPSAAKQEVDIKHRATGANVFIPAFVERKLNLAKKFPPLPPISEPYLEEAVFTHTSANATTVPRRLNSAQPDQISYERLEFMGDAYIELLATRLIYSRFPHMDVSRQSQLREILVKNETLQVYSQGYGFPDRLKHGGHINVGAQKTWIKVQADIFEAYIGALVLSDPEHGFAIAEAWLTELWAPHILNFKEAPVENAHAREQLNKLVAMKGVRLAFDPEKPMEMINGIQRFYIGCYLTGWGYEHHWLGHGEGQNKSQACILAAMDAMENNKEFIQELNRKKLEIYPPTPKAQDGEKTEVKDEKNMGEKDGKKEVTSAADGEVDVANPEEEKKEKKKRRKERKEKERAEKGKDGSSH
ncbi:ribonuclease III domain-containing protein [Dendryphion nanum]|uniref:Ribonuclease III domain-containing protein n=1 Tax=Dendryphion nanum TaxID=256645 RepID=A0A9P9DQJ0_9PLEO|nr:ribonuclease III domain-containing protein [Dendryphion nanum]